MRRIDWILIVMCTISLGLHAGDRVAMSMARTNCRPPVQRPLDGGGQRWIF